MTDIKPFAQQLDDLLNLAHTYAQEVALDLEQQLELSGRIEAVANDVRETNLRVFQKLLTIFSEDQEPHIAARARDLADGIARELWSTKN